jgi:TRAP transporter 4TM/12TM fusion protein
MAHHDSRNMILTVLGVGCSLFMLVNLLYIAIPGLILMTVLLTFMFIFGFYKKPLSGESNLLRAVDFFLMAVSILVCIYVVVNHDELDWRGQTMPTSMDLAVFLTGILLLLELTRRAVGPILPIVAVLTLIYALVGENLGTLWGHPGFAVDRIIGNTFSENGIFTTPMRVVVRYIFLFLLFGEFMNATGVGNSIISLANAVAGRSRGGPAKVAVIASALFGSVSGSALANVGTTGAFTIPMMKKLGYPPHFAGAVEAVASTGGQWMPPVMAGTAFILCEFVGIPYSELIIAAFFPALLYYICIMLQVDLEAVNLGLRGLSSEETPSLFEMIKKEGYLFSPLIVLIIDLLVVKHSIVHAAFMSLLSCIVISWFKKSTRMGFGEIVKALSEGAQSAVVVTAACACAGIIIGVLGLTGLGTRLSSLLIELSGGIKILLVFFTSIVALILGMGMPTTGAYIICAVIMGPALVAAGFPILSVHMLILYYAVLNCITPPVALAAYFAASLAEADPMRTAVTATKLGIMAFVVPIIFLYNPEILLIGNAGGIILSMILCVLALFVLAMGFYGKFYFRNIGWSWWQRVLFTMAAGCMMTTHGYLRVAGVFTVIALLMFNRQTRAFIVKSIFIWGQKEYEIEG